MFIGRTDAEAETPVLWPPDVKSWLIWKDPDAGKDWRQQEKGTTEDEMVWWHHRFNGHRFGWTPGVGDGQGGPVYCGSWGCKESDTTEWLNCYLIDLKKKKKSLEELFIRKSGKLSWQGKSCWHNVFSLICHRHLVNDFGGENFKSFFFNKAHDTVKI